MHFDFSANQILWTLTFASELVLLVVLLGRDRARRFPWFMGSIILSALLLLISRLLFGRMAPVVTSTIFLVMSDLAALISLMVVAEVARRAFATASRRTWIIGTLSAVLVAVVVLIAWGPWPKSDTFTGGSMLVTLRSLQLFADKGATLGALLCIELGILVVLFGRRFGAGWRSHPQQIAIGLSTAGIAQLGTRVVWQFIAGRLTVHTQAEYQHAVDLRDHIYTANNVLYWLVMVWWIAWLWLDEPGTAPAEAIGEGEQGPEPLAD
jgi:hypothetical protein